MLRRSAPLSSGLNESEQRDIIIYTYVSRGSSFPTSMFFSSLDFLLLDRTFVVNETFPVSVRKNHDCTANVEIVVLYDATLGGSINRG